MNEIDSKIIRLGLEIDHQNQRKFIIRCTTFLIILLLLRVVVTVVVFSISETLHEFLLIWTMRASSYTIFIFFESFIALHFIFAAYLVRERFSILKNLFGYEKMNVYIVDLGCFAYCVTGKLSKFNFFFEFPIKISKQISVRK